MTFTGPSKVGAICKRALTRYLPGTGLSWDRTLQKQTVGKPARGEARPCLEITQAHMKTYHEPIIVSHQGTDMADEIIAYSGQDLPSQQLVSLAS